MPEELPDPSVGRSEGALPPGDEVNKKNSSEQQQDTKASRSSNSSNGNNDDKILPGAGIEWDLKANNFSHKNAVEIHRNQFIH